LKERSRDFKNINFGLFKELPETAENLALGNIKGCKLQHSYTGIQANEFGPTISGTSK
jgi:hypothetical protein